MIIQPTPVILLALFPSLQQSSYILFGDTSKRRYKYKLPPVQDYVIHFDMISLSLSLL